MPVLSTQKTGVELAAFPGDNSVLLAFNLDANLTTDFAGFAVYCTPPGGQRKPLVNRIGFKQKYTSTTTPQQRKWTPTDEAPLQKFHWVYYPADPKAGNYLFECVPMFFTGSGTTVAPKNGVTASVQVHLEFDHFKNFKFGFTRGYISSQAYASRFNNKPIRPTEKSIDYDTTPYEAQYEWLGGTARKLLYKFLSECEADAGITLDAFIYDCDEPDFIAALEKFGSRLRVFADDASLHTKQTAVEPDAWKAVKASAGENNFRLGHFSRFAHNKVLIAKRGGNAERVLTGSANFSVRGLYVQANNVLIFDDATIAGYYADAFETAFSNTDRVEPESSHTGPESSAFKKAPISKKYFPISGTGLPTGEVAFSPHTSAAISLTEVSDAILAAKRSVLFAIMNVEGSGDALKAIHTREKANDIFLYGVTQNESGALTLTHEGSNNGVVTSFAYLKDKVPAPFQQEYSGGSGQTIHHKFVVTDFNGAKPRVFTGSSNLAGGGEQANGDNLIELTDPEIVQAYAVEAIRLVDHYHFRAALKSAKKTKPLELDGTDAWAKPFYDASDVKMRERLTFIGATIPQLAMVASGGSHPHPSGGASVKTSKKRTAKKSARTTASSKTAAKRASSKRKK